MNKQSGILEDIPQFAIFLESEISSRDNVAVALETLKAQHLDNRFVVGIGAPLPRALGKNIPGLVSFPDFTSADLSIPSTQGALWINIRGSDEDTTLADAERLEAALSPGFSCTGKVPAFKYDIGRDLTGYEDGTENPVGEAAVDTAIVKGAGPGMDGSAFVAVQQWLHDFTEFDMMTSAQQDDAIGRHRESNEEFDAPPSAHVKRTAQEDFDPEAYVLRRSMPWSGDEGSGLMFVAYGRSFYSFDVQMRRMIGAEDGIIDGLFQFSRPVTGSYYWCPPLQENGRLDLSLLGI